MELTKLTKNNHNSNNNNQQPIKKYLQISAYSFAVSCQGNSRICLYNVHGTEELWTLLWPPKNSYCGKRQTNKIITFLCQHRNQQESQGKNLSVSSSYLHWTSSGIERATTFSFCCSFREQHWSGELVNFIRLKFLVPAFQELQGYGKVYICQNNCILLHWIYEPTQPPTSPSCCSREDRKIVPSF